MLFEHAITRARSELADTFEGTYSYANEDMLRYAIDGVQEAWGMRPSLQYDEQTGVLYDKATVLPASVDEVHFQIPLPTTTQEAIVYYMVYGCLSRDVTDENNAKAAAVAKERFTILVMR